MQKVLAMAALTLLVATGSARGQGDGTADWVGAWRASEAQAITITAKKGGLRMIGSATWGMHDPDRVARGAVNFGDFDVTVSPDWIVDERLAFVIGFDGVEPVGLLANDFNCIIEMAREGETLLVADNNLCGGLNVTFTGTYRRE
jgi:hypothetical protein